MRDTTSPEATAGRAQASFAQERFFALEQILQEPRMHHLPFGVRLRGPVDVSALEHALADTFAAHDALRTTLDFDGSELWQIVRAARPIRLQTVIGAVSDAAAIVDAHASDPLPADSLISLRLAHLGPDDHLLSVVAHHGIFDGRSREVFVADLISAYAARVEGREPDLAVSPVRYAEIAAGQRRAVAGAEGAAAKTFFRELLQDAPQVVELPGVGHRNDSAVLEVERLGIQLDAGVWSAAGRAATRYRVTRFSLALTAGLLLLARGAAKRDVLAGVIMSDRLRPETDRLVGALINTVPVRGRFDVGEDVANAVLQVADVLIDALQHAWYPFDRIVRDGGAEREVARAPLVQVLFAHQLESAPVVAGDIEAIVIDRPSRFSVFDLTLTLEERADRPPMLHAEYAPTLIEAATVRALLERWELLIEGIAADGKSLVHDIPLVCPNELSWLQRTLESQPAAAPYVSITGLVQGQADQTPDGVAVIDERGQFTYGELIARASGVAHAAREAGVRKGDRVAVMMGRSASAPAAILGVGAVGAVVVPVDPAYPAARVQYMLQDSAVTVAIVDDDSTARRLPENIRAIPLDRIVPRGDSLPSPAAEDTAYIIYTSGSTGAPKGVVVEHRSLANVLAAIGEEISFSAADRLLAVTTFSFDIALLELLLPLSRGGTVVVAGTDTVLDPSALAALARRTAATVIQATPTLWRLLVDEDLDPNLRVLVGGETLAIDLARTMTSRFSRVWNVDGPTEATIWSSLYALSPRMPDPVPIGRPLRGNMFVVLDEFGRRVPPGVPGELYIGGDALARGYWDNEDATAERFGRFEEVSGARLYRTGDLVRVGSDGNLVFLGRLDQQVKIRGHRIELEEIEVLLRAFDGVTDAAAVAHGSADLRLVAFAETQVSGRELRRYLADILPGHMIPTLIVPVISLPKTPNGKIDRSALSHAPLPAINAEEAAERESEPSRTEKLMLDLWSEVLAVSGIGLDDNFFDVGGDSLRVLRLTERARESGLPLTATDILRFQTIRELAEHAESLSV